MLFFSQLAADKRAIMNAYKQLRDDKLFGSDFYVVEKAMLSLEDMRENCPHDLPADAFAEGMGVPRIYHVAALISANPLGDTYLSEALDAYQQALPLCMRELWALPGMLRISLLKRIRVLMEKSLRRREAGNYRDLQRCIADLRYLENWDAETVFETYAAVEKILSRDPVYANMDAASRAYYRNRVERLSGKLHISESAVAENAILLCRGRVSYRAHAGYYLVDEGEKELRAQLRPDKPYYSMGTGAKLSIYIAVQLIVTSILLLLIWEDPFTLLALPAAWSLANAAATALLKRFSAQSFIPRLRVEDGNGALVVIPTLLAAQGNLDNSLRQMETHYLANRLPGACFAVLGDFKDSKSEQYSDDENLMLKEAQKRVRLLNEKYAPDKPIFFFLHRRRTLNEADGLYMGRERKRGALEDLLRLLLYKDGTPFMLQSGELPEIEHILTLDEDTILPLETLQCFIGAVRHPLNRPVRDNTGKLLRGYGVLFPIMRVSASSAAKTSFARIVSGDPGVESYRSCVAEFYMNVFGSGIFGGKGIWNVKEYMLACENIPAGRVLCHDLLEGSFSRAGLMSDISLYDSEMSSCFAWWKRAHRWIRGDWQLVPFLSRVPLLARYQICDNIRRSLKSAADLIMLLALPHLSVRFAFLVLLSLFWAPITAAFRIFAAQSVQRRGAAMDAEPLLRRSLLDLAILPYAAWRCCDAAARALYRMLFSHKKMLEWQTAAQTMRQSDRLLSYFRIYWINMAVGAFQIIQSRGTVLGFIIGMLWLFSPLCLYGLERPKRTCLLSQERRAGLMDVAERTWRFFSHFASEDNGYLPPDNVQESPLKPPVRRSSPTNIGMAAVSAISAFDLGFLTNEGLCTRLSRMADTLEALDTWHGHLYNWYDLRSMQPCEPRYVSSVDSGNFACAMLSCAQAALSLKNEELYKRLRALAQRCDFTYLYDRRAHLFYIGYDVQNGALSPSHYDLLASEARLLSFVSIALGQIEKRHWFGLGRLLNSDRVLMSWSGTMFEYLMPLIFTGSIADTLLYASCKGAVQTQIEASVNGIWGISESGYYGFDRQMYYQYAPFGAPKLALSDSQKEEVVAPYATLLALTISPSSACDNLERLERLGALGEYGFYEAVDFEKERVGDSKRIVKSYMAHHQGMGLCAIADLLRDGSVRRRFMQTPEVYAARLLLEEKIPRSVTIKPLPGREKHTECKEMPPRSGGHGEFPETQMLSNGRYAVFCTEWGGGFSRCGKTMLTRWRPGLQKDPDMGGVRVYIATGREAWEINGEGEDAESEFSSHEVSWRRTRNEISSRMRVAVSAQHDAEIREIVVSNCAREERTLTLGVFFEVCLATQEQDMAHPAFQKLRVDTFSEDEVLLFSRRNTPDEAPSWMYCLIDGAHARFCTERLVMPGRGKNEAEALLEPLPDTVLRSPLEPGCHIRAELNLAKGDAKSIKLIMGWASEKDEALRAAAIMREEKVWEFSHAYARSELYFWGIEADQAAAFERLAGRLILRVPQKTDSLVDGNALDKLWSLGISGDNPILLTRCRTLGQLETVRLLSKFIRYFHARGENFDAAVLGSFSREYGDPLRDELEKLRAPNFFIFKENEMDEEAKAALLCLCSLEIDENSPKLKSRAGQKRVYETYIRPESSPNDFAIRRPDWMNGAYGFEPETGDYIICLSGGAQTPLPWCNILCNESFGTLVSERGGGYTWGGNSRLDKLTPWHNDPVTDKQNETLIFTDEETGQIWNPLRDRSPLCIRHSTGLSTYTCGARALYMRMKVFTDAEKPYKYTLLELENPLMHARNIKIEYGIDWRLGDLPHNEALRSGFDGKTLSVRELRGGRSGFAALTPGIQARAEYAQGCSHAALNASIKLSAGERREILLLLGSGKAPEKLPALEDAHLALKNVRKEWNSRLGILRVNTGDADVDRMLNVWLPYQTETSRLRARTGYYQCGGAIGFRDQLQDMLSIKLIDSDRLKRHILLCASMQFKEGDVLHWWHPGDGYVTGVRTRIQDDRLFLPYALLEYLLVTEDMAILDEQISYLEDIELSEGKKDAYARAYPSGIKDSLYAHCAAALNSVGTGAHGLCLMGGGDWNDAMDRVGEGGGESVWLSFFMLHILERFAPLAEDFGEKEDACGFIQRACELRKACEGAWDGAWYKRAYFADGSPLGTRGAQSCAIDCITQAWAAICKAEHAHEAFEAMLGMLLESEHGILKLLSPPFSPGEEHPAGYIQAYLPGVRENGGQYTHGACWAVMAACELGLEEQAEKLFKMLLPVSHTANEQDCLRYKGEPYVAAGDVYALDRAGRAGWTWYTGAAGWLYTIGVEYILGIRRRGNKLVISPVTKTPFSFSYRAGDKRYDIEVADTTKQKTVYLN